MKTSNTRAAWLLAGLIGGAASGVVHGNPADSDANSTTVLGTNTHLSDGAAALMNGDSQHGVELTELGINGPSHVRIMRLHSPIFVRDMRRSNNFTKRWAIAIGR